MNMQHHKLKTVALASLLLIATGSHADGDSILQTQCAGCHTLQTPDAGNVDRSERLSRLAPPLHFAGNKYRQEWLENWLTEPYAIHPSGYFPVKHTISSEEGDIVDPDASFSHPALSAEDASEVAAALMQLRSRDALIEADNYQPGTVAMRMGMMDFRRFKGCDACHQDSADSGGLSGPTLYNAAQRLQPSYLSSFIQNPVAWDANTTMPVLEMNEQAVHRLVHYLLMLEPNK